MTQRLASAFEGLLYVAVFGGLAFEVARAGVEHSGRHAVLPDDSAIPLLHWLAIAAAALLLSALFKTFLTYGPIFASRQDQMWLLSTPIDRRMLLLSKFGAAMLLGTVAGIAVFVVLLSLIPSAAPLWWLATGGALGATGVSTAILVQQRPTWTRTAQHVLNTIIFCTVSLAIIALLVPPAFSPFQNAAIGQELIAILIALLAAAGAVTSLAFRALGRLTRAALSSGVDIATATAVSVSFLDPSILSSIIVVRRARSIGRVRSARIRGGRVLALLRADWTRVRRMRFGLIVWLALIPVPYLAGAIGLASFLPAVHVWAAFLATDRLAMGLRFVCRSNAIRRALGGKDWELRLTHLIIPAIGAITWCAVTLLTSSVTVLTGGVSAAGALIVTYRIATRPPLDYAAPSYDFGLFGPTPIGLIIQLSRGPAMLLFLSWLQITLAN